MIKVNELRTGNKVLVNRFEDDEPWETTVEEIGAMQITASLIPRGGTWVKYEDLEPIPLTPEWLERCGFKFDNVCEIYELNGIMLCEYHGEGCRLVELDREGEIVHVGKVFAYVHQLQNIYLDLHHEELTIKETV